LISYTNIQYNSCKIIANNDAPPTPQGTQLWAQIESSGKGGVEARSLAHNPLRGRGAGWSSGMGLGRVDKL